MAQSDPSLLAGIPTLDIRAFINGSETEKAAFAAALGEAYETIGFAAIHGHGISDELIASTASPRRFLPCLRKPSVSMPAPRRTTSADLSPWALNTRRTARQQT